MGNWKMFFQRMPEENSRIVALYSDGSGAGVFLIKEGKIVFDQKENELVDLDWFLDAGYMYWTHLPDGMKTWTEMD